QCGRYLSPGSPARPRAVSQVALVVGRFSKPSWLTGRFGKPSHENHAAHGNEHQEPPACVLRQSLGTRREGRHLPVLAALFTPAAAQDPRAKGRANSPLPPTPGLTGSVPPRQVAGAARWGPRFVASLPSLPCSGASWLAGGVCGRCKQ